MSPAIQTENLKIICKSVLLNFLLVCNETKREAIYRLHFHREKSRKNRAMTFRQFNLYMQSLQYHAYNIL